MSARRSSMEGPAGAGAAAGAAAAGAGAAGAGSDWASRGPAASPEVRAARASARKHQWRVLIMISVFGWMVDWVCSAAARTFREPFKQPPCQLFVPGLGQDFSGLPAVVLNFGTRQTSRDRIAIESRPHPSVSGWITFLQRTDRTSSKRNAHAAWATWAFVFAEV